jgi:hypothetical protein
VFLRAIVNCKQALTLQQKSGEVKQISAPASIFPLHGRLSYGKVRLLEQVHFAFLREGLQWPVHVRSAEKEN